MWILGLKGLKVLANSWKMSAVNFRRPARTIHVLATRKERTSESSERSRLLNPKVTRVATFGTSRYFRVQRKSVFQLAIRASCS